MNETSRIRMAAAIAVLATLAMLKFLMGDIIDNPLNYYFVYLSIPIPFVWGVYITASLLAVAAYLFAVDLVSQRLSPQIRRTGNAVYALGLLVPLVFLALFLIGLVDWVLSSTFESPKAGFLANILLTGLTIAGSITFVVQLLTQFGAEDKRRTLEGLELEQTDALARANGLLEAGLCDLAVIESFRAIETGLKRRLVGENVFPSRRNLNDLLALCEDRGILEGTNREDVHDLRILRNAVVHENETVDRIRGEMAIDRSRVIVSRLYKADAIGDSHPD